MDKTKKGIWGWAMYDWANSAFATTVMAGFFPIFFKSYWSAGADVNVSTAQLGAANSIASLIVALMAPILGAIADKGSAKKKFLIFFAYLGALMTAGLFLVQEGNWQMAIFVYIMGIIGFSGANIFYDALLPSVTNEKNIDRISGLGFGMGYLGGGVLFALNVAMTLFPETFGLDGPAQAVRISFLSVALWWGFFTLFTIFWVEEKKPEGTMGGIAVIKAGFKQYLDTWKKIRHLQTVSIFLLAYWFYIDGVDTIIRMAVDYGMSIGFESNDLIIALLITQFVGFPAAIVFGRLGEKWGVRKSIYLAIFAYIIITFYGVLMTKPIEFYALAIAIGLVQGGIQALSRSYYSRLIPKGQEGEFYGFYNMLGKFAAILGPLLIGVVGLTIKGTLGPLASTPEQQMAIGQIASRWGIGSVVLLFVIGAILFKFVDEEEGKREAAYIAEHSD
ncbi:MAG: MFS transporter [Candidatus Marinimicrobia bacterium]|jgi:UMF1 family MFS transporter|nr:MFS transporter [Candidatus Neomarinimicrobiota bacterium]MBT3574496.1 MFS transporter [Candidatus Neomarinimicrobiota bacterium]MBT3679805.1 MFS transporter [Candidatus Neomarinimicrobiota bacterium]MBT3950092.1 MFS transporter [Candidatus Neomarinimicrobiota bacterium]MBT4253974.1 MFS transporter [Candidatus Neomarinimicrobiota bacterium]